MTFNALPYVKQEAQLSQRGRAIVGGCVCSQLTYVQRSFLLIVTAASDLLVHKILLNSVLLSPIVSGGVRLKPPGQTPLGYNSLVGRIGSGVRVSVSFEQKCPPGSVLRCRTAAENGVMTTWVVFGRIVEPVINTSSSSCANN